jgi:two-component system, LytTR family, response regulator AlgR
MTVLQKEGDLPSNFLLIHERDRTERIALADVLYIKAELKYLTVHTVRKAYLLEGALNDLEARHADQFLRVHRNALVARHAMRALEKHSAASADEDGDTWVLRLHGVDDTVAVSRRQLPAVRAMLAGVRT